MSDTVTVTLAHHWTDPDDPATHYRPGDAVEVPADVARSLDAAGYVQRTTPAAQPDRTADELRDELKARGLPTAGSKATLAERLRLDDEQQAQLLQNPTGNAAHAS